MPYNGGMGRESEFRPCLLITGVLSVVDDLTPVLASLEDLFGPVSIRTEPVPFGFTDYYDAEMGRRPMRSFLVFENLFDPEKLAWAKRQTDALETAFAKDGGRTVNLDPGLLNPGSLILATTKASAHRIPLRDGIWAETTLIYRSGSYRALDWTYADYRSEQTVAFFNSLRPGLLSRLKELPAGR